MSDYLYSAFPDLEKAYQAGLTDAARDAAPRVDAAQVAFKGTMTVFGDGSRDYQFIDPSPNLKHGKYEVTCSIAASAPREET